MIFFQKKIRAILSWVTEREKLRNAGRLIWSFDAALRLPDVVGLSSAGTRPLTESKDLGWEPRTPAGSSDRAEIAGRHFCREETSVRSSILLTNRRTLEMAEKEKKIVEK